MADTRSPLRVLVTGATGFVGSAVVQAMTLVATEVHGVARHPPAEPSEVRWHALDLFDREATTSAMQDIAPDLLVHTAWCATPPDYRTSASNLEWLTASIHLAQAFARAGGRRFVGIGTGAEYDPSGGVCHEDATPLRPIDLYGASKVATFEVLTTWCRQVGIQFVWPRLFSQYGPGEHPSRVVAYAIRSLLAGQDAHCSSGTQQRDFLHVADVGRAIAHVAREQVVGAVNIGSGTTIAIADVLAEVDRQLAGPARIVLGRRAPHPGDAESFAPDVSRLRRLGWRPEVGLVDGIADSISWWRGRGGTTSVEAGRLAETQ